MFVGAGGEGVKPLSLSTCRVPTPSTRRRLVMSVARHILGKTNSERAFNILRRDMWKGERVLEPAVRPGGEPAKQENGFGKNAGLKCDEASAFKI